MHDKKYTIVDGKIVNRISGEAIPEDEPVILFRARDRHALGALAFYRQQVMDPHHRQAVTDRINEFWQFQQDHRERMKEPGITHDILLNSEVTLCADCGLPQYPTPSGKTCMNGHGGADSVERKPLPGTGQHNWPKLYYGDWRNLALSQIDRVRAHRAEFDSSLKQAVDAVRAEEQRQKEAPAKLAHQVGEALEQAHPWGYRSEDKEP